MNILEDLRNQIKLIGGVFLDQLYKEISIYLIIKEQIYNDKIRNELNLPIDVILNRFGLKKVNLFDPIYLPEQLDLAFYIKENNFEYFNDFHYVEYKYNHYEHGYELKNIIERLKPMIEMIKKQRTVEFEKQLTSNGNQKNSLNSIREQMKTLDLKKVIEENLELAIKHFENGDFLASTLISSRIIIYGINKIPSNQDSDGDILIFKGSPEDKVKFLRQKGIINKDERDKKLNIVKYVKKARDYLVHDIKRLPEASESMALLGDCIDILKILKKIEEI
ncbi:MAG: hypothetical protein ACFFG0_27650 [Candidatus Thorarchaeota archaeon]